jgi:plastocyanin
MALRVLASLSALLLFAMAGCSGDGGAEADVGIHGFAFDPASLNVDSGTTVVFTNHETAVHTATADNGAFDSGDLEQGESYDVPDLDPGTYPYHCARHSSMHGTLVVA